MNRPPLILASGSPRRQFLLKAAGIEFTVSVSHIDEHFPADIPRRDVAAYLATQKAAAVARPAGSLVLAADTTVIDGEELLEKPADRADAIRMLKQLSGKTHEVITGVCLSGETSQSVFSEKTAVRFRPLSATMIEDYVDRMQPYDKAGAYGIQECLPEGFDPFSAKEKELLQVIHQPDILKTILLETGRPVPMIDHIEGSFFNVMGLPLDRVYALLRNFNREG